MPHPVPRFNVGDNVLVYHGRRFSTYPATIVKRHLHLCGVWHYEVSWDWNHGSIFPNEWIPETEIFLGGHGMRVSVKTNRYSP